MSNSEVLGREVQMAFMLLVFGLGLLYALKVLSTRLIFMIISLMASEVISFYYGTGRKEIPR